METPNVTWTKETTAAAANGATCLSELLEREGFYKSSAIGWLTSQHIAKFCGTMDAVEAGKLMRFSAKWHYTSNPRATKGLPFLRELCECSDGPQLICRLAELEPAWVNRWLKWQLAPSAHINDTFLTRKLVPLIGHLSSHGITLDAVAIVDVLISGRKEAEALELLNQLIEEWKGPAASDPVTKVSKNGDKRLDAILHLPWQTCGNPSERDNALWSDGIGWDGVGAAIATALRSIPGLFTLELGFSCGRRIAEQGMAPSVATVDEKLRQLGITLTDELVSDVLSMVDLWATLRKLAEYEKQSWNHKTELVGLRAKVVTLVAANPQLWAQSLQWILARSSEIGQTAEAVTFQFSSTNGEVRAALESACDSTNEHVRLKARGLKTLLQGLDDPDSAMIRTLADAAARYLDGTPMFPHPLAPLSATWLGSIGVEHAIANGVKRASERFAAEVREQGGDIEESLTKALVKEIEVEFRNTQPRLELIGVTSPRSQAPVLSVRQRPASKALEEPIYGCDIAWLITGNVRGRFNATWVDLVQVKKSSALQHHGRTVARSDSWRIDAKQLDTILHWSSTSTYWMIASTGDILVIPAKHLAAIRRGTKKQVASKTFTVGYHEVRSVAIPLEQYLVDLLIGQWLGTSSDDVVQFALGENTNIRPRAVIEVSISVGKDN